MKLLVKVIMRIDIRFGLLLHSEYRRVREVCNGLEDTEIIKSCPWVLCLLLPVPIR